MNFYKHFLGDYARDTAHLSMIEHGAYRILLDTYYATSRPLPAGKRDLYRIAKAISAAERKAVNSVADQFFPVNGDGYRHNQRADAEIAKEREYSDSQRTRAIRRWGGDPAAMPVDMPAHMPDDMPGHSQRICPSDATTATVNQSQKLSSGSDGFLQFWKSWPPGPRKAAKEKCLNLWKRKKLEAQSREIVAHVEAMKATDDWRRGYVPAPVVYLRDGRWEGAEIDPKNDGLAL